MSRRDHIRTLGKLAEISDLGIPIYFFVGNHDLWMNGYFEEELNIPVFHSPQIFTFNGKKFLIGHGDGLGPGDKGYKRMKKVFTNKFCKWLFRWASSRYRSSVGSVSFSEKQANFWG